MAKITVKTKEAAGQVTYETETTFEDASDYFANEEYKRETLASAVKNFVGGLDSLYGESPFESEEAGNATEIKVGKKAKEPTRH